MNTEELKMVLETIGQLGAAGKEAFVIWVVLKYGAMLIQGAMLLCGVLGLPWIITRCIVKYGYYGSTLREIGKMCGVSSSDFEGYDGLKADVIRRAVEEKISTAR